jgi:hypothetical protein
VEECCIVSIRSDERSDAFIAGIVSGFMIGGLPEISIFQSRSMKILPEKEPMELSCVTRLPQFQLQDFRPAATQRLGDHTVTST